MRMGTVPLLILLILSLLSCTSANTETKMGSEKQGDCGEVPVGITVNKGELDLAGSQIGEFSQAKLDIKFTPEFQKVLSESSLNALVQDYILCKAISRAGVYGDPEMVDYFTRLTHFLSKERTVDEQQQWRAANPFPKRNAPPVSKEPLNPQFSGGANSPNIRGDQNTVTIINHPSERVPLDMVDEHKIYVECENRYYPNGLPTEGKLRGMVFVHRTGTAGVTAPEFQVIGTPGGRTDWLTKARGVFVCQITNYGKVPVLKVQINFGLRFMETKWLNSKGMFTHRTTGSETWTSQIRKLDPWPPERFEFVMKNDTNDWLVVSMPEFIELQVLGESQKRRVPLLRPDDDSKHTGTIYRSEFWFTPTNWPQSPPPGLPDR